MHVASLRLASKGDPKSFLKPSTKVDLPQTPPTLAHTPCLTPQHPLLLAAALPQCRLQLLLPH
jgi:hypothetical protein